MTKRNKQKQIVMDNLRSYEEIANYIPQRMTRRQCISMSSTGRFPPYARAFDRAPPLWSERDIVAWITDNFQRVAPAYCARLQEDGLTGAPFSHVEVR